jgi:hypothetical protein
MQDNIDYTDSSVSGVYENYTDTQIEIMQIEIRKTRNVLFTLAAIILVSDIIGLAAADAFSLPAFIIILIIPLLLSGMAFLSLKEPLIAMIVAAVIIAGIWIYTIIITGGRAAIMGWLIKAVIIYFIIAGFRHAAEASKIKRELKL